MATTTELQPQENSKPSKCPKLLSRNDVETLIAKGKVIVIYKDHVLNLGPWLKYHPGGDKAVYHMVGKDATDEMLVYHGEETISKFTRYSIGRLSGPWQNLLPPIQGGKYSISEEICAEMGVISGETGAISGKNVISSGESGKLSDRTGRTPHSNGTPEQTITPVVPQNITYINELNKHTIFPIHEQKLEPSVIVDPKEALQAYENSTIHRDLAQIPLLDPDTQANIKRKYLELHVTLEKDGLYECDYWNYIREVVKIVSLFLYSFSFLRLRHYFISALFMALAWHQMTFIAHDAGHVSLSHNYQLDNIFGMIIADWFGGLSLGWWKRNHNVHHLVTNDPTHDPDIQHLPFFAVSTRLFGDVYSTYYDKVLWFDKFAQKVIPYQEKLYYPILAFGRFNLYRLSWTHLLLGQGPTHGQAAWFRYFELAGLSFFFYWFFYLLVGSIDGAWNKFMYVMVSHMATMLVHVQITLSHFAMSTADLGVGESFPSRQIRTSMDVDCPEWFDFFHGGLQFQAIHHLFPRLPRHNLRRAQLYVIGFCQDIGLPYSIYGFGKGNQIVLGKLAEIGKQCSIMLDCTKKMKQDQIFD